MWKQLGNCVETISFLSDSNGKERLITRLKISKNATELNGGKAATVKDQAIKTNIEPSECNCKVLLTEEEKQKIIYNLEEYKIEFVLEIFPKISIDERKSGIPAEIRFAQMCLESSYGTKTYIDINMGININNYFGIKGIGPAGSVSCKTKEEILNVCKTWDITANSHEYVPE